MQNHIIQGDYFGTLATIINLIEQKMHKNQRIHKYIMKSLVKELVYLQKYYTINVKVDAHDK